VHDDRELLERRIARELWERVLLLVHAEVRPLVVEAGPDLESLESFETGRRWGPPWGTTWFRFRGDVPAEWSGRRVEALIDPGFDRAPAGFQCEALVVEAGAGGVWRPVQGIHPRRTAVRLDGRAGPVEIVVEAASNPSFPQFRPSPLGLPESAGERPLYRFRSAFLAVIDEEAEALVHDLDVVAGVMGTLSLDDPRRARLRRGAVAALDRVPDVGAARAELARCLEPIEIPGRHRIIATGHAHIDTAWLWPTSETIRKCTRTFASAVGLMEDHPEFRFTCSQAQQYAWIEEHQPDLFERIRDRVERGQWVPVGGMWVEADMNLPSGESLVRQIVFGQRYFEERFGLRCREVWIPDVFGYPAGLPQVFRAGGMDRFVTQKLSWNKQNRFPHHTFWWEGLDGSRVLTHFPPVDTYNAEVVADELAFSVANFQDAMWSSVSLMPFGYGDGGGGPTREMLERARRLANTDARFTLEIGSADEVFVAIEREALGGAPVPVWRGELYFETHRGTLTSQLRTKVGNRLCERLLVEAELWAATLGRAPGLDDLWRDVLTQQFHDILPGSSIAWVHRDAEAVFERVSDEVARVIEAMTNELAPPSISIANPADAAIDGIEILPPEVGIELESTDCQQLADDRIAVGVHLPPLAVAPLRLRPIDDRVVVTDSSMANRHLAVRWARDGTVTSIIDLAQRREIVPDGSVSAALELARDHPVEYDAWDLESWTRSGGRPPDGATEVTVLDSGPLVGRIVVKRSFGPSTATTTYELRADERELRVHLTLDWHHDEHLLSIVFPLDVRADTAACDVQFGVCHRPTHSSSPWDAAKFEVCAHRFVSVAEPGFGVAVLNDGRYGHSVFDSAIRVSLARATKYPDPEADHGRHEVTLALRPHDGDLAAVRDAAARLNRPVRLVVGGRAVSETAPLVDVSGHGVEVDAVKLADDGSGDVIVRLHEALGGRVPVTIAASRRIAAASRCDLLEEPERGEEVGDGIVSFCLRPFELVTVRLSLTDESDGRGG